MDPSFNWRDMLRFDKMIAPTFLTLLYYIHTTASILASLWFVQKGLSTSYGGGAMVLMGLLGLVVGPFVVRLFYELLIVIFKIHTRLSNIDYTLRGQPVGEVPSDTLHPTPSPGPNSPFIQPDSPAPAPYSASERSRVIRPLTSPLPEYGAGAIASEAPLPDTSPVTGQPMPDFWKTDPPPLPRTPAHPVELGSVLQKVPNWPAVLATLLVLYAVLSPYAVIGYGSSVSLGELAGITYSIKNSSVGIIVVLAALVMLGTSAGGLKRIWFVGGYGLTLLGSVFAFLDERSIFSQLSNAKATMNGVDSTLGGFIPQADQLSRQMADTVPSASQFLTFPFYLFILATLFLGYWALSGNYQERGLLTNAGQ